MPLVMPMIALTIVLFTPAERDYLTLHNSLYELPEKAKYYFLYTFGVFGFVAPVVSLLILRASRIIDSVELDNQRQRNAPIFLTGAYAAMLVALLLKVSGENASISAHALALAIAGAAMSFLFLLINLRWKISLHAGGVGAAIGFVFAYFLEQSLIDFWPVYLLCIIGGGVLAARLYLNKHSSFELYLGLFLGSLVTFITDFVCVQYWTNY